MSTIWKKYQLIKEINSNIKNIKTYLAKIEPLIKEIIPKNNEDYFTIKEKLEKLKNIIKIYDIIEEKDKFYVAIENEKKSLLKFDELMLDEFYAEKEGILEGHGNPVTKDEITKLFKMENSMCKILFEIIENNQIIKGKGAGFFLRNRSFSNKACIIYK